MIRRTDPMIMIKSRLTIALLFMTQNLCVCLSQEKLMDTNILSNFLVIKDQNGLYGLYDTQTQKISVPCLYYDIKAIGKGYFKVIKKYIRPEFPLVTLIDSIGNELFSAGDCNDYAFESNKIIAGYGIENYRVFYNIVTHKKIKKTIPDVGEIEDFKDSEFSVFGNYYTNDGINKYGLINDSIRVVVPAQYKSIRKPKEFLAAAQSCKKVSNKFLWGFVDTNNNVIIPFIYLAVHDFSEGIACVTLNGKKWGGINKKGVVVIPFSYDYPFIFKNGCGVIRKGDKYGVIDRLGHELLPAMYNEIKR